jgi:hypothetical protein
MPRSWDDLWGMLILLVLVLVLLLLGAYIVAITLMLMYKVWFAIQPGHPRTTPGKAVIFSFIPFFNLCWIFQLYWGFAKDYNSYAALTSTLNYRLKEGLFPRLYCHHHLKQASFF